MIASDIFRNLQKNEKNIEYLLNPGTGYLTLMEYYCDEKILNSQGGIHKIDVWEKFIARHFSNNVILNVKIFEKDDLFYEISKYIIFYFHQFNFQDSNYDNLAYVYMHKNKNLFNKWIFLDNYIETIEKDEENVPVKVMNIKNCLNILEYKKNKVFIYLDAIAKINTDLKIQYADIKISNVEIYDEVGLQNINLFEVKSHLFSLYKNFKSFMQDITNLISDLNFLNNIIN